MGKLKQRSAAKELRNRLCEQVHEHRHRLKWRRREVYLVTSLTTTLVSDAFHKLIAFAGEAWFLTNPLALTESAAVVALSALLILRSLLRYVAACDQLAAAEHKLDQVWADSER